MQPDRLTKWEWRVAASECIAAHVLGVGGRARQRERWRLNSMAWAMTDVLRNIDGGRPCGEASEAHICALNADTDRKAVRRGLVDLQGLGLLDIQRRGRAKTTRYRGTLPTDTPLVLVHDPSPLAIGTMKCPGVAVEWDIAADAPDWVPIVPKHAAFGSIDNNSGAA